MKAQMHSGTSRAAAISIAETAESLRAEVYRYIARCGAYGATDEETQTALHMVGNTERPRRIELFDAGIVADSGARRPTRSGRQAVVWVLWKYRPQPGLAPAPDEAVADAGRVRLGAFAPSLPLY